MGSILLQLTSTARTVEEALLQDVVDLCHLGTCSASQQRSVVQQAFPGVFLDAHLQVSDGLAVVSLL